MLNFSENSMSASFCDRLSRRSFLQIGSAALAGLSLPELLRAEALSGSGVTGKNLINIILSGGPSHLDMFDLKPEAPVEYRGEFTPITTRVPGFDICQHFPSLATLSEKFTAIRSMTGINNEHTSSQSDSGWTVRSLESMGGRPSVGSVMSRIYGPAQSTQRGTAPTFVDLSGRTRPGYLGQVHSAYRPDSTGRANLILNQSITRDRLSSRQALLGGFDRLRRDIDGSGMMDALDSFTERAVGIVTSGEIARAIDIRQEDPRRVARYGYPQRRDVSSFITARRLIQAGVRCVSFSWGSWDTHSRNFVTLGTQLPALDRALSALIEDLDAHGQLDDTIIMMSGEFGRTPRVNGNAGRDHWPQASTFFLAGGGFRHGQFIGATNARGERPQERPVDLQHVFSTVYRQLGIDPDVVTLTDPNGRPQYLTEKRQTIPELA